MNSSDTKYKEWQEVYLGSAGTTLGTEIYPDNNETSQAPDPAGNKWDLNTMLAVCLGPLGVALLISYIFHWIKVVRRIKKNIKSRRLEKMELPQNKVSSVMTILTLQNERSGIYYDDDNREENGI